MVENKIYEKGTLGWLREQAKKDGFDNIRDWQNCQNRREKLKRYQYSIDQIKNIYIVEKILEENKIKIKDKIVFCRFWEKVDIKEDINECWLWTGFVHTSGYGSFRLGNERIGSHRIAYILTKGSIPDELQVQHICNNRICCNPHHLKLDTPSENTQYAVKCDRWNKKGENNPSAILTETEVREIHKSYNEQRKLHPKFKQWQIVQPIAKKFGISNGHVNCIIRGENWQYIYKEFH